MTRAGRIACATLILACATGLHANAENGWVTREYNMVRTSDAKNARAGEPARADRSNVRYSGVLAHTRDPSQPGVLFACSEQAGLSVTFALEGIDFADIDTLTRAEGKPRAAYGDVFVDDAMAIRRQKFIYRRKLAVAHGIGSDVAYRTIDAIYQGDPVAVAIPVGKPISISLPALDETLKAFVAACPAFEN